MFQDLSIAIKETINSVRERKSQNTIDYMGSRVDLSIPETRRVPVKMQSL